MNKYQQALNNCVNRWAPSKDWNLLKELVEKATPKKPKEKIINVYSGENPDEKEPHYYCPDCLEWVGDEWIEHKYCPRCGQAIDWGTGNNV